MELLHQAGEIIAQRYRIKSTLGQGGIGITYAAIDLQSHQPVALKALSLRRMADWKALELFERESKVLSQLNHPAIPRYLNYFQVDTDKDRGFYLVQQLAVGASLANGVENGWNPDETKVKDIAIQILEILVYLQSLTPPIIHRDIKPQNIIYQKNGRVFLVDFGSVQDVYHHTVTGGSTVVGTYGYMAPEQFRGQAVLSTDLYGLGMTLLFLLTRKSPADLPQRKLKVNFRSQVQVSKEFADWLEKMIEPIIENRFPSAEAALAVLQGKRTLANYSTQRLSRPKNSSIIFTKTEEYLVVEIPPQGLSNIRNRFLAIIALACNSFLLLIISSFFTNLFLRQYFSGIVPWLLCIELFFGLPMLCVLAIHTLSRTRLEIEQRTFELQRWLLGWCFQNVVESTEKVEVSEINPIINWVLSIRFGKYYFGKSITQAEKEWLVGEIKAFLKKQRA